MDSSRRAFLRNACALSLGFVGLQTLIWRNGSSAPRGGQIPYGFGKLVRDPNGLLDLPEGFGYKVFSTLGEEMDDGLLVPGRQDGMAAFPGPNGTTLIVRNHENDPTQKDLGPFGKEGERLGRVDLSRVYDPGSGGGPCQGGTSTLVFDTRTQNLLGHRMSLLGTSRNCAGGPTPWNSWVTCEETVDRAGEICSKDHGYCFEVPANSEGMTGPPVPLVGMGRFNHEAIAVDPQSGAVYETEDREDGLLYRYLPHEKARLAGGGKLQALVLLGRPSHDMKNWEGSEPIPVGSRLPVGWVDLDSIESPNDDLRFRGFDLGAARFARGEGMWSGKGSIYLACTTGGTAQKGQIWRYHPSAREGSPEEAADPGMLELFIEPNDGNLIENCDNLTVAPWGDLIVCEDGSDDDFLVGVTPKGEIYKFARSVREKGELAGVTFSPDGSTLFFNIQELGLTLAVTGREGFPRFPG